MRRTRRRRSGGTWLPTLGTDSGGIDGYNFAGREVFTTQGTIASSSVIIVPLTFDRPQDPEDLNQGDPLIAVTGGEYLVKRIVGKIHIARTPTVETTPDLLRQFDISPATHVGAGFFVARAQDSLADPDQPIGSNSTTELNDNYNPLDVDNIRLPWIWRRTWVLGSYGLGLRYLPATQSFDRIENYAGLYPPTTAQYGSVMDGPHFDAKSRRRIKLEERLFFVMAQTPLYSIVNSTVFQPSNALITATLDYRIFASMRRARGRSSF